MYSLELNQFAMLLWKNFTIKRRQFFGLLVEVLTALMFAMVLLLFRSLINIRITGPYRFASQPINTLPSFLKNSDDWELIYIPSNIDVLKEITENVKRNLNISIKVKGFSSETEFEKYVKYDIEKPKVLAAIVFDSDFKTSSDPLPLQVKYHLRFVRVQRSIWWPDKVGWKTGSLFPVHPSAGPRNPSNPDGGSPGYIREGFLAVQHALDKAIMLYHESSAGEKLFDSISIFVQRFPYPAYHHDGLLWVTSSFLPLIFILMFSPTVLSIMQSIVNEKEKRLKDYQLIVGLKNWMIWATYFFTVFPLYVILISLICILFFAKIINEPIFRYSDYSFIFVFLMCYAIASILFGFMLSTFFSKVRLAASAGNLLFFATFFPFNSIVQHYGEISLTKKVASCLSSNVALALGINLLLKLEIKEIGVKWDNLWKPTSLEDNLIFGYMMGMLLLDAFLYVLVTWYVEAVFPGQYGVPQPWYFFLMRSYWFGTPEVKKRKERKVRERTQSEYFETVPSNLVADIQIKHLCKIISDSFPELHQFFLLQFNGSVAVNNLSLNSYKGQITVLLGHNGAGKTTTLSILTGNYLPTSGEAYVNRFDISKNMVQIRKTLGFCPQQDLFFNDLTVSEHLLFYCVIKGVPRKMLPMEIDYLLSTFNLREKRDAFSQSLTGGMKRKLSVIIALIGDSKVLILDEPTSGMDLVSRRTTWDLLQRYKQNRTILLTTQYMDEADVLGDRIAIMVKGTLQCCGSSVFLKQIYGAGYHIVMEREPHCDVEKISELIRYHIPNATLENNIGAELSFILPKKYIQRFEGLFNDLDKNQKELGIASFGASVTTMEEVFFKVCKLADSQMDIQAIQPLPLKHKTTGQDTDKDNDVPRNYEKISSALNELPTTKFNTGFSLHCQQFRSMLIKRALFTRRNWKLMLLQLSVIILVTTYLLGTVDLGYAVLPSREMDLGQYGQTIVPYSISGNSDLALNLIKNLEIFLKTKNQELRQVNDNALNHTLETIECRSFCIIALSIKIEKNKTVLTILFNNEAYHSSATSLAVLDNILFMSLSGPSASIRVSNKPQPFLLYGSYIVPANGLQIALCLSFGMAVVVGTFCVQTVTETISNAKHIQFVSGVHAFTYWFSALLWDLICYSIPCCLLLGVFKYCGVDAFVVDYQFLDTMLIFMLYGWCVLPLMYLGSFLFSSSTVAYIKLTLFNYCSTVSIIIILTILQHYEFDLPKSTKAIIYNLLMLLPNYNFAMSISKFFDNYELKKLCSKKFRSTYLNCSKAFTKKHIYNFGEHGIAKFLVAMAVLGLFFLLLLLFVETAFWNLKIFFFHNIMFNVYKMLVKSKRAIVSIQKIKEYEDEDVKNERKKVLALSVNLQKNPLLLKELTKIYYTCPVVKAVRNISLVVKKSECFGLLGLNGAGKSTTFKMLTGEETTTSGAVLVDGISITENIRKVRSRIGYCPQSDSTLSHMTGRELMIMYARLWGIPEPNIYKYVEAFLCSMRLGPYADKFIYTYSGGNRRKLSTAIALMGNPSVVILDEPSTGMDPVAQRLLWDIITRTCKAGKAIIITSHSVEECEALCTRLAIIAKGKLKCLGSPQHLKKKFGNIHSLTAKLKVGNYEDKMEEFKEFITKNFPGNIINQEHEGIIDYYIPSKEISWGKVFNILEEAKVLFNLEDYSISQITLEQVFLTFANIDKAENDKEIKLL
ncbi:phospholipid-transporting ATPase ABCA3-like isoform X2 [Tamandua tetradactyla]|uniref:phospholipid-transporting ATPase ABCA3-like isoform X2 n=1 Tax=Tamandua tetradactyla TaxID=48850 RepID=UPI004053988B